MQNNKGTASVPGQSDTLLDGVFDGPTEFALLVRDALACAAQQGWPEMVWSDASFEDWPLREKSVVESLQTWARTGRRLVMISRNYDAVQRYLPRFVNWRNQWGHIVECRLCKSVDISEFPSALWSPQWMMRRTDVVRCKGLAGYESQRKLQLKEALDECRRRSVPGFPTTILGL